MKLQRFLGTESKLLTEEIAQQLIRLARWDGSAFMTCEGRKAAMSLAKTIASLDKYDQIQKIVVRDTYIYVVSNKDGAISFPAIVEIMKDKPP